MPKKIIFEPETIENILKLYCKKNLSMLAIANIYKRNSSCIKRVLLEQKIKIRDTNFYKSKSFNENYFDKIDNQDKAYWLGFLYADGYITNQKTFGIKLSVKDFSHLEKLKNSLESAHNIYIYTNNNGYGKGNKYCALYIQNSNFFNSLIKAGICKNKSRKIEIPNIKNEYISHFIRGIFDGDGSVSYAVDKKYDYCMPIVSICGLRNILIWIKKQLPNKVPSIYKDYHKNKITNCCSLSFGGINNIKIFFDYIYNDADIFLERKKEKFEEIFKLHKT